MTRLAYHPLTRRYHPLVTYDHLLELARDAAGQELETLSGRKFAVGIYRDALFFTPASTGRGQTDGHRAHERFVERFNESGSMRPGDYAGVTRNASYLIGLLRWAQARGEE